MVKHDKTTRAFISYSKKWLNADEFSTLSLDSCEGVYKAIVLSKSDDELLIIEIRRDNKDLTKIEYNRELNKWREL